MKINFQTKFSKVESNISIINREILTLNLFFFSIKWKTPFANRIPARLDIRFSAREIPYGIQRRFFDRVSINGLPETLGPSEDTATAHNYAKC